jgi:hypothetical protein
MFNFWLNPRLKKILHLTIPDFLVRLLAVFIGFYTTLVKSNEKFALLLGVLICLFAINIFLENVINKKLNNIKNVVNESQLTVSEIIQSGNSTRVINSGKSAIESIYLFFICLLIVGYSKKLGWYYIAVFSPVLLFLVAFYIKSSLKTLFVFYGDLKIATKVFLEENLTVIAMIFAIGICKIGFGLTIEKYYWLYLILSILLFPRYLNRRKRMRDIYEAYMNR